MTNRGMFNNNAGARRGTSPGNSDYKHYFSGEQRGNVIPINAGVGQDDEPAICPEDGDRIAEAYEMAIGQPINAFVMYDLEQAVRSGRMTVGQVLQAICQTAYAARPSPAYLRAIIKNAAGKHRGAWWMGRDASLENKIMGEYYDSRSEQDKEEGEYAKYYQKTELDIELERIKESAGQGAI